MKIKLVLDINKTQQAQLNAVVTGRQGDKETVTVNVFIVDSGVPYNLTGQDIYYEGLKPNNAYVRDKTGVKMINATQGNFEYTFRPETFGVAGVGRRSYFSIEQGGTVRASTQDFGLVTLADAMTGNTMSGPYISELEQLIQEAQWLVNDINSRWTSINTQLTQLQNKLNTMDVVKRSGDTMTGNLKFNVSGGNKEITATDGTNDLYKWIMRGTNFEFFSQSLNKGIFNYNNTTGMFNVTADTNLLKKTGDTMTGQMTYTNTSPISYRPAGQNWWLQIASAAGLEFNPSATAGTTDWDWGRAFIMNKNGVLDVEGLNVRGTNTNLMKKTDYTSKDGRADLVLTDDATNFDTSRPPVVVRRGNTVTIRGAIGVSASATANVVTTLPTGMRPIDSLTQTILTHDGSATTLEVYPDGRVILSNSAKGKNIYIVFTYVVN
ncbi:BppU family phage baseplate upper protein [Bacillus pacificus]|uniref:BppU family phage baseplate upper protein n=1 Tax=Bacillus pacificus TaxID=2026187 RepID=UPI002D78B496|nr:BppU family phage baseplate upper protein [Bacillus pacificus]